MIAIEGDARDSILIMNLLKTANGVISTLGSADSTVTNVCTVASLNLVNAMRELHWLELLRRQGPLLVRIVIGSEHPNLIARRNYLMPLMSSLILDGEAQMRTLLESRLAWTVIRLPRMLFDDRRSVRLLFTPSASG